MQIHFILSLLAVVGLTGNVIEAAAHDDSQAQFRKQNEASYVEAYNLKAKYKEMTTKKPMSSIKRRSL